MYRFVGGPFDGQSWDGEGGTFEVSHDGVHGKYVIRGDDTLRWIEMSRDVELLDNVNHIRPAVWPTTTN